LAKNGAKTEQKGPPQKGPPQKGPKRPKKSQKRPKSSLNCQWDSMYCVAGAGTARIGRIFRAARIGLVEFPGSPSLSEFEPLGFWSCWGCSRCRHCAAWRNCQGRQRCEGCQACGCPAGRRFSAAQGTVSGRISILPPESFFAVPFRHFFSSRFCFSQGLLGHPFTHSRASDVFSRGFAGTSGASVHSFAR
jgi:hypothetical protein